MLYNLTMLIIAFNLSLNASDFNTDGLINIRVADSNPYFCGMFYPVGWTKGKIIIYGEDCIKEWVILHELKHFYCYRQDRTKWIENMNHKGCFTKDR